MDDKTVDLPKRIDAGFSPGSEDGSMGVALTTNGGSHACSVLRRDCMEAVEAEKAARSTSREYSLNGR